MNFPPLRPWPRTLRTAVTLILLAPLPWAEAAEPPQSGPVIEARYRHEGVDDAAFSLGAALHRWAADGQRVVVATLCGGAASLSAVPSACSRCGWR